MKATRLVLSSLVLLLAAAEGAANSQLVLKHGTSIARGRDYKGIVDLVIDPGFDNAKVAVSIDGQQVATALTSPYHLVVDFGPTAVQHRMAITATSASGRRTRWSETINEGKLPLSVTVKAIDVATGLFEAETTAPDEDPVEIVQLWDNGQVAATTAAPPYRFTVPPALLATGFVQVTARTKSGEEVADFWSPSGNVHVGELQVRTVPIFVSVVDRNGVTHDNIDRSLFRVLDNGNEAKIIEFGKAFDQPISIALLLDSSASMTYSMQAAGKAAAEFVTHALKPGDRCSITAVQDVPRRKQPLTDDRAAITRALEEIVPDGRTALFDSLASAIRELRDEKNRRAIVLMTDGTDTSSNWSFDDVESLAREAGIPIYFIVYEGDGDARSLDRLNYLATQTGGFMATATQQNLMARYSEIERDLRAQFAITYQVSDFGKSNEWRNVRVLVDSPKLTARTIKGYFTP
jgi:Ca-activated chloride channel homolog